MITMIESGPRLPLSHVRGRVVPFVIALVFLAGTADVAAYIDPGTGSYLFQLAAAGALATLFVLRRYWHAIKTKIRGLIARKVAGKDTGSHHDGMA